MNMLKRTLRKAFLVVAMAFSVLSLKAQNEAFNAYTPYSMFGVGEISKQGTSFNKSMGGVGIATRDRSNINILNPAAVTERDAKSFMADIGLFNGNRIYKQHDMRSANNVTNVYNIVVSFPVYKSFAVYGGITPYSDIGYGVSTLETDQSVIGTTGNISYNSRGYGSLNNLFLGGGFTLFKGFSVGAEFSYIFGNLHKNRSQVFDRDDFRSIYSGYNMHLKSYSGKFGVQYEIPVSTSVTAVVGATYRLKSNLRGTVRDFEYCSIGSVTDTSRIVIDTLQNSGTAKLGNEIGVGISLKGGNKWTAEIDYLRSDWTNCGMETTAGFANVGQSVFSATASQSVRAGFSIVPNRNDIRYYMRRVTYRAGAYWDQAYYKLDGNSVNAFGLTFGMTLPVSRRGHGITVGVDLGQRGSLLGNMVRERYVNFNIGLNIADIWFLKQRYD